MRIEENNFLRFYMVKKKLKKSEKNKFLRIYLMYYGKWEKKMILAILVIFPISGNKGKKKNLL